MKKRLMRSAVGLVGALAFLGATVAVAQDDRGDWSLTGAEAGQNGWQKNESTLTPENAATDFKFLWKIKLGQPSNKGASFSEPLLAGRLINAQGFKDIVYWASADTLYAVDSELGSLIWKKVFASPAARPAPGCGVSSLDILMEPPLVIHFRRKRAPGAKRPPVPQATDPAERRLGVAPGGGYFGLKGIYLLTPDGMLHEQVMTTGADFAPSVRFLPAANGRAYGLNFTDNTIYTATGRGCSDVANGVWAIDLTSAEYPVASYTTHSVRPLALSGPVITSEGSAVFVTGFEVHGQSGAAPDAHAGSVISLAKDMKVEDWYTPERRMARYEGVSPAMINYKDKEFVVAPGEDGTLALLDAASLGGADHHTPVFQTPPISKPGERHGWDGFASWQDKSGTTWVFASISAGVSFHDSATRLNGPTPHGAIVAFRVEDASGRPALNPVWASQDMINPAPPRVANGVVIALSGGSTTTHARLYALNAATGAELYSSKDQIPTYTRLSGVSIGDGHAFFTDHENVLYSFGIGMEH